MTFENKTEPLINTQLFVRRQIKFTLFSITVLVFSLWMGMVGYHHFAHIDWINSFYNASMILTGMGPALEGPVDDATKLFAGIYALYSGVAFLSMAAILFAPIVHRMMHLMNIDED